MDHKKLAERQKQFFSTGKTRDILFRKRQLKRMGKWMKDNEAAILLALKEDLNKSPFEAYATEYYMVWEELHFALRHMEQWCRDSRVKTPLTQFPAKSYIRREPYGTVLILSPWNYPFQLTLSPLIGAVCAGNCAVVKPSAYSPHTSAVIKKMIEALFPPRYIAVVEGGRKENKALLEQAFDTIFFTGSAAVGRQVMEAASRHLTPVSLELGGKSPCIVDQTADIPLAAKRIVWGKFLNAGQTCVAPDYVLAHKDVKERLIEEMKKNIVKFYGENPLSNEEYPRIVNQKHYDRLMSLIEGERVSIGGTGDAAALKICPTLLPDASWHSKSMEEEIFGPILPILEFSDLREAAGKISRRPKPLALYFFSRSRKNQAYITRNLSYGGGCINDTVVHLATPHMPFGGVGESGMGGYHGKAGFETFSHKKSIMKKSLLLDIPLRYPPYENHLGLLKWITGWS